MAYRAPHAAEGVVTTFEKSRQSKLARARELWSGRFEGPGLDEFAERVVTFLSTYTRSMFATMVAIVVVVGGGLAGWLAPGTRLLIVAGVGLVAGVQVRQAFLQVRHCAAKHKGVSAAEERRLRVTNPDVFDRSLAAIRAARGRG